MTARVEWMGEPLLPRETTVEFTLMGDYVDVFQGRQRVELPEQTLTIRLQPGQRWTAASRRVYRRGQPVTLYINDERFDGRVKFRYREKLVCVGRFAADRLEGAMG